MMINIMKHFFKHSIFIRVIFTALIITLGFSHSALSSIFNTPQMNTFYTVKQQDHSTQSNSMNNNTPIIIAHRGASGYLPEHTLEAATLAYSQGADFIEQDLVLSKDLVPVVLHDIHLDTVTDVAEKFPNRSRDDGRFYAFDFTLNELKQLRVLERRRLTGEQVYPDRYSGKAQFTVATFEEQIELVSQLNRQFKKDVGLYPEIKSPAWHKEQGADISAIVLKILRKYALDDASKPIFVQCFDFEETKRLRLELSAQVKLIQLIGENIWQESKTDYEFLKSKAGLTEIAKVAQGIGPSIHQLIYLNTSKDDSPSITQLSVKDAQSLGLQVHPYTFRKDDLPKGYTEEKLLKQLFNDLKVDGLFSDFTDIAVRFLEKE